MLMGLRHPAPLGIMMAGAAPRTRTPEAARTDAMDVQGLEDARMTKLDPEIAERRRGRTKSPLWEPRER